MNNEMNGQKALQRDNRYMPMSVKDWLITYLIMFIPMVNFIMLIVWSVSDKTNVNRQNWARAAWIMVGIIMILAIVVSLFAPRNS